MNGEDFNLFTTTQNGKSYIYSVDSSTYPDDEYSDDEYYNEKLFKSFADDLNSNMDNPSIMDLVKMFEQGGQESRVDFIKTNKNAIDKIFYTVTLSKSVKAGDVIYFYTDKEEFEVYGNIEYMVVITKELEGATLAQLIEHATIVNPFSFAYLESYTVGDDSYLASTRNLSAINYNVINGTDNVKNETVGTYAQNFSTLLGTLSESVLNCGVISDDTTRRNNLLHIYAANKSETPTFDINSYTTNSNETTNSIEVRNREKASLLKISNMYVKNRNKGNIETEETYMPRDLKFYNGYIYTLKEDDFNYGTYSFVLDKTKLFNNTNTVCDIIIVVMTYKNDEDIKVYTNSKYCSIEKYVYSSDEDIVLSLEKTYGENTSHNIQIKVDNGGIVYCSRHTIVDWDVNSGNYVIKFSEDDEDDVDMSDKTEYDPTEYVIDTITADENKELNMSIFVPKLATDVHIYANSNEINNTVGYSNSWCSIGKYTIIEPELDSDEKNIEYKIPFGVDDNIPTVGSDSKTAKDYNSNVGTNTVNDGCDIFNAILNGVKLNTSERTLTLTVKYNVGSKKCVSYKKLTQPGYVENRKIPKVELTLNKDLVELERANNIENGVLCNQFQFFVDVDITDFDRSVWGSYV